MRALMRFVYSFILTIALVGAMPGYGFAQGVNDFIFRSFHADLELSNEDKQGFLSITEQMEVDFSGQNRGILRAIPNEYKGHSLNVTVESVERDGNSEQFTTYEENNNTVLRVGNPSVYITGEHSYTIRYHVENVISFYDGYDELYWDINGDQWSQEFVKVTMALTSPATIQDGKLACYSGVFSSTEQNCSIEIRDGAMKAASNDILEPGETLTVVVGFDPGYFAPMSVWEKYRDVLYAIPFWVISAVIAVLAYRRWLQYGKDLPDRGGVVAPYFGRPKHVSVMQAAYVLRQRFDTKDISAAIIDLAIKGNLKIVEKSKKSHTLELLPKDYSGLTPDEVLLLTILFPEQTAGNTISLSKSQSTLYTRIAELRKKVDDLVQSNEYFTITPAASFQKQIKPFVLSIIFLLVTIFMPFNDIKLYTIPVALLCIIFVVIMGLLMERRSQKGVELKEHMEGLKLYLDKAEKDRIKMHDAVAAPLGKNADTAEPAWTREFFEKLLPFAIVFGVDQSWAKAFEGVYTQPPEWYQGDWKTFRTAYLVSGLSRATANTAKSFTAPSSSGSSGFSSGGGFSGGGGGGGGGGGW